MNKKPCGKFKPHISGYTLPEILITMLLLGILFTLALTFSSSTSQSRRLRDYSIAVALAQQAIEVARAAPYKILDEVDAGEESLEYNFNNIQEVNNQFGSVFESNHIRYKRKVQIDDVMAAEDKECPVGLKRVKVTVEWQPPDGGKAEPFKIETLISDLN